MRIPASPPLVIWDCESVPKGTSLGIERESIKQGNGAICWRHQPSLSRFSVPDTPKDWTGYHLLRLWIHNAAPVPAGFMIILDSENPGTKGPDYWGFEVKLNFTGWKELILPIGHAEGSRTPRGWDQIDGMTFVASGWGNTPQPDADLLIDDIRLESDVPRPGPRMADPEFLQNLDLDRPELQKVRDAVDAGDLEGARAAFLTHMRSRTQPKWWFDWRERPAQTGIPPGSSDGWDYYATRIKIDWTGWKEIVLPFKDWGRARKPIGWHFVSSLSFSASYGDRAPSPDTILVLDEVMLEGENSVSMGGFEDAREWIAQMRDWVEDKPRRCQWRQFKRPVRLFRSAELSGNL